MRASENSFGSYFILLTGALAVLLVIFDLMPMGQLAEEINLHAVNILGASVILVQGVLVLRLIWNLEMRAGGGSIPIAWSLLMAQHLMFGLGGWLVAIFNFDYFYNNEQGVFAWDQVVLPMLFVHAVSLNVGLLGVFLATGGRGRTAPPAVHRARISRWNVWSWDDSRTICYITLALHSVVWIFIVPIHTALPDSVNYVAYGLAQTFNAAYVLWGLSWSDCKNRRIFIVYTAVFGMISMLEGQRGEALAPLLFFGIGYLTSPGGRRWDWRAIFHWAPWAVPLLLFIYWISLASEDMRHSFTRGSLESLDDTVARIESMVSGGPGPVYDAVGSGDDLNGPFRFGARLFELSGADVISRTPGDVPYWGWSGADTAVLLTGFLPLKLNSDAAYNNDPDAGVLFLQSYGWIYVDPTKGNSMPATLIGDAWRRFSWVGVIGVFFFIAWGAAKVTLMVRSSPWRPQLMIFTAAMLSYNMTAYDSDFIYLLDGIPRRVAINAAYAAAVYGLSIVFGGIGSQTIRAADGRREIVTSQVPASRAY